MPNKCLYCSAPLDEPLRTSNVCPACDRVNLREDLRIYRTKHPIARSLESTLKAACVLVIGAFTAIMLGKGNGGGYAGTGYAIGTPLLLALVLWDSIGLITRRHSVLVMRVFWPIFVVATVVGPLYMGVVIATGTRDTPWGVLVIAGIAAAGLVAWFGRRIWRIAAPRRRQSAR